MAHWSRASPCCHVTQMTSQQRASVTSRSAGDVVAECCTSDGHDRHAAAAAAADDDDDDEDRDIDNNHVDEAAVTPLGHVTTASSV